MSEITDLLLVGTIHGDFKSPERIKNILEIYRPDSISIEQTPTSKEERNQIRNYIIKEKYKFYKMKKPIFIDGENAHNLFLDSLYSELLVPWDFADARGIPIYEVESREVYENKSFDYEFTEKSFRISEYDQSIVNSYYYKQEVIREPKLSWLKNRDEAMVSNMLVSLRGRAIHFGGFNHIFGDYHNLYNRLEDLNPTQKRLNEFDVNWRNLNE